MNIILRDPNVGNIFTRVGRQEQQLRAGPVRENAADFFSVLRFLNSVACYIYMSGTFVKYVSPFLDYVWWSCNTSYDNILSPISSVFVRNTSTIIFGSFTLNISIWVIKQAINTTFMIKSIFMSWMIPLSVTFMLISYASEGINDELVVAWHSNNIATNQRDIYYYGRLCFGVVLGLVVFMIRYHISYWLFTLGHILIEIFFLWHIAVATLFAVVKSFQCCELISYYAKQSSTYLNQNNTVTSQPMLHGIPKILLSLSTVLHWVSTEGLDTAVLYICLPCCKLPRSILGYVIYGFVKIDQLLFRIKVSYWEESAARPRNTVLLDMLRRRGQAWIDNSNICKRLFYQSMSSWTCRRCTFINPNAKGTVCDMCGEERVQAAAAGAGAADQFEISWAMDRFTRTFLAETMVNMPTTREVEDMAAQEENRARVRPARTRARDASPAGIAAATATAIAAAEQHRRELAGRVARQAEERRQTQAGANAQAAAPGGGRDLRNFTGHAQNVHDAAVQNPAMNTFTELRVRAIRDRVDDQMWCEEARVAIQASPAGLRLSDRNQAISILTNNADMSMEVRGTPFRNYVAVVWNVIRGHRQRADMIRRLAEELSEGRGVCALGRVGRLINALRGFIDVGVHIADTHEGLPEAFSRRVLNSPLLTSNEAKRAMAETVLNEYGVVGEARIVWITALEEAYE